MSMRNTSWLAYLTNFFSCVFTLCCFLHLKIEFFFYIVSFDTKKKTEKKNPHIGLRLSGEQKKEVKWIRWVAWCPTEWWTLLLTNSRLGGPRGSLTLTSCNKSSSTDTICSATFWTARSFLCICVVATHSDTKTCVFRNRGCLGFSHHGNFPTHADWQHQQKVQGCSGDSRSKAFHTSSLRPYTPVAEGHMHCSNTQVA